MKTAQNLLLIAALVALPLAGCGGKEKEEKGPILIGGTLSLTGIQAPYEGTAFKGAQLAVEELNKQGGVLGRSVEFTNVDGESDLDKIKEAAVQLIEQGAVAIIVPADFDFGSPASQEAQKAGIVGISPAASSPLFNSKILGDKQFTLSMWNTTMGAAAAEYAYQDREWTTVYVVTDKFSDYTTSLSEYFIAHFESLGGQVLFEDTYLQGDKDFSAQLARIQALEQQPDFLYISSYMPDLEMIIRTLREAGINLPIIGGDTYDDSTLFEALGAEFGNDIFFVTQTWLDAEATQDMARFLRLHEEKFGEPANTAFIATGWDTIMVLARAMEAAGTTEGAAVAKKMEEMEFVLLTGKLSWSTADEGHEPDKEAALVEVQGGVPSFIGWGRPKNIPEP